MRESLGHYKAPSFVTRCKLNSLGVGYSCVWMSFSLCLHVSTDSTVAVAMYYPWQASVNIYYTIQSVNNLWLVKLFWFIIFLCLLSYYSRRLEIISLSLSLSLSSAVAPLWSQHSSTHYHLLRRPILLCSWHPLQPQRTHHLLLQVSFRKTFFKVVKIFSLESTIFA